MTEQRYTCRACGYPHTTPSPIWICPKCRVTNDENEPKPTQEQLDEEIRAKYAEYELRPLRQGRANRIYALRQKLRDAQRELNEAEASCPNCAYEITMNDGEDTLKCKGCGEVFTYKPIPLIDAVKPEIKIVEVRDRFAETPRFIETRPASREVEHVEYVHRQRMYKVSPEELAKSNEREVKKET